MGALLVILVAVSRSAKNSAEQHVAARQQSGAVAVNEKVAKKLTEVRQYVARLGAVRSEGEVKLRDEQRRLSHMDDHIRRLREQLKSLQLAEIELDALEEEHYDDRKQAEREVERLQKLVFELQAAVAAQRAEYSKHKKSYALVPYKHGANGTFRRPIYLECVKGEVILQPEGVTITEDDLRPPYGAGNALAAAVRAARDHLVRMHPEEGQSRDTEPYPLVIVRPEGMAMAAKARRGIEAGDFDFGIEYIESDWKLRYATPDPKLAELAQIAIEEARLRQEVLAAAAPRAFNHGSPDVGEFETADDRGDLRAGPVYEVRRRQGTGSGAGGGRYASQGESGGDFGGAGGPGGNGEGGAGSGAAGGSPADAPGDDGTQHTGVGGMGGAESGYGVASGGVPGGPSASGSALAPGGGGQAAAGGTAPDGNLAAGTGEATGGAFARMAEGGQHGAAVVGNSPEAGVGMQADATGQPPSGVSMMTGTPPATVIDPHGDRRQFQPRERDWAIGRKPARAVPVRRSIHVVVRGDQLAILPDDGQDNGIPSSDDVVKLQGDTVESIDRFVERVRHRVEGWGIAGQGLYWRPVLMLTVGPDGGRRAEDLVRILKNSGLEVMAEGLASKPFESKGHETR
jgi:hypothetical protein